MEKVADAFEQLTNSMNSSSEMPVNEFYEACYPLRELFSYLDGYFNSAQTYYVAKIDDLYDASQSISTLQEMLDEDIEAESVRDPGSHTNNLLKLKRGLELIKVACQEILLTEGENSIKDAAIKAYNDVLDPYLDDFDIKEACVRGLESVPSRSDVLYYTDETEESLETHMQSYVTTSAQVIEYLDELFDSKDIPIDW